MTESAVEWRRKTGGRRAVHGFVDGVALCRFANNAHGLFATTAWEPAPLAPNGTPYGAICVPCENAARRR